MTSTLDPEPLPKGYFCDPSRTVNVSFLDHSPGVKGLAFAILLRAVEDGCNKEWLQEIAEAYEIEVPENLFKKAPVRNLAFDVSQERYVDIDKNPNAKRKKRKFKALWLEGLTPPKWLSTTSALCQRPTSESTTEAPEPSESSPRTE